MINELKPYVSQKDSGVAWLGRVPTHWEVQRGKWLFRHRKELNTDRASSNVLSLTLRGVVNNDPDNPEGLVPKDYATYQLFQKGDLVFKLIDLENLRTSRVGLVHEDGIMSSAYVRLILRSEGDIYFFFRQYFDLYQRGIYNELGAGVRSTLGPGDLLDLSLVVPPLPEQAAIVRFIDHADRRIQGYIRRKRKLIALLDEQKQRTIHSAVISGLDPNVRLEPSGVQWMGDVPQHWEVLRVKQCARTISKGTTPSTEGREILEAGPVRFLKAENISGGKIVDKPLCFIDEETNGVLRRSQLREDDVLFVIAGATLGKTAVVNREVLPANTNQAVAFVRPNKRIVSSYLALWLQSPRVRELTWLNAVQSAQPNLSMTDLGNFLVPLPPVSEQHDILRWLNDAFLGTNKMVDDAKREIDLLREYRTRLVSDVVTGKLDVREASASLPDEPHVATLDKDESPGGPDVSEEENPEEAIEDIQV